MAKDLPGSLIVHVGCSIMVMFAKKSIMNTRVKVEVAGPIQQTVSTHQEMWYDIKSASKIMNLGFGRTTLFRYLRSLAFLMEDNEPYQEHIDSGLFKVTLKDVYRRNGSLLFRPTVTLISAIGIEICQKKIIKHIQTH